MAELVDTLEVEPGKPINVINRGDAGMRVTFRFADGAEVYGDVPPGGAMHAVAGAQALAVIIDRAEGDQHLRVVD